MGFGNAGTGIALFLFLMLFPSLVLGAPSSHITEEVSARYFWNGSLDGDVATVGYVEVDVENTIDVLQFIRLQLSGISGTNLKSATAYKNVAASPHAGDRTRIFVNTTRDSQDIVYNITDPNLVSIIKLKLDYQNSMGGNDMYSGTNTLNFNLSMNATRDVFNVITNIRFSKDTLGSNDAINLYNPSASEGIAQRIDSDWDGFYDTIRWDGDLTGGNEVIVSFQGIITPGINFDENLMLVDLDNEAGSTAGSSLDNTLTGITFVDRFSRGPIREGVEIMERTTTWLVRGLIRNVANSLDYVVHSWDLYKIGEQNPVISSSGESYLNPGDEVYTDWYDTGSAAKDYYASSFDWEVVWGSSQYSGVIESRIYLPVLYEIDSFLDKTANLNSNTQAGRVVSITDLLRHLGHSNLGVNGVNITSRIPGHSVAGEGAEWSVTGVRVFYSNNTGQYEITSDASISTQNANPGQDGFVVINITDLQSILGHVLQQNEDILLSYTLSGPSQSTTQDYNFGVEGILITESGTPMTRSENQTLTIPGVYVTPPPEGPYYPPPAPYASIEKELAEVFFITPEYVQINVTDRILDTGDKGIKDIKAMVYIPFDGSLDFDEVFLSIYHASSGIWEHWIKDRDFTVTNMGVKTIGENRYTEYMIEKKKIGVPYEETIDLFNGDKIKISFKAKIPVGTNYILTRIFGYNYYEDKLIFEDVYTPVRREGIISRLEVEEKPWEQEKVLVGRPVVWTKEFDVHNPNNVTVEEILSVPVFQDVISVYLVEYGNEEPVRTRLKIKSDEQTYVDWIASLDGFETKIYAIEITTPPVLETKEVLDVLESNESMVKFFLNITLVNFALEDYYNISFFLPLLREKIISIQDGEGNPISFFGSEKIEIILDFMSANQTKSIYLVYKETPPIMITTIETLKYHCQDFVSGIIFIIPSKREGGAYIELEVMGPEPDLKTLYADLILVGELRKFEEEKIPIRFAVSSFASGRYIIYTKFKKDFGTILYHQRDFVIDCPEREIISISWVIFAVIAGALVAYLVFRIYRKKTYKKEIRELRRRIKRI